VNSFSLLKKIKPFHALKACPFANVARNDKHFWIFQGSVVTVVIFQGQWATSTTHFFRLFGNQKLFLIG